MRVDRIAKSYVAKNIHHLSNKLNKLIDEQKKKGYSFSCVEYDNSFDENYILVTAQFTRN